MPGGWAGVRSKSDGRCGLVKEGRGKAVHYFTTLCTTTDDLGAQAAVGLWDGCFGGGQKRLTSLLHFVLQLTNLKPKPPWAFGTVVLEGVKKGSLLYYTLYYN